MSNLVRRSFSQWRNINRICGQRFFHDEFTKPEPLDKKAKDQQEPAKAQGDLSTKYQIFKDSDAAIILDVEEERTKFIGAEEIEEVDDPYAGISREHGLTGVIDLEELVEILKRDNAGDIFVCKVPREIKYVDHIVVVSGNSYRHMLAMSTFVRRVYKMKRKKGGETLPKIEGEKSKDWMAIDLGNIALHVFSKKARKIYDLESLWSIGRQFDVEYNKPDDSVVEMYKTHSIYLNDFPKPKSMENLSSNIDKH